MMLLAIGYPFTLLNGKEQRHANRYEGLAHSTALKKNCLKIPCKVYTGGQKENEVKEESRYRKICGDVNST